MKVTIGELIEILSPWCIKIELSMVYDKPFMKAYISGLYGIARFYLYIIQSGEYKYQVVDSDDDINEKYIPTGNSSNPFITEKDLASLMFDNKIPENINSVENLDFKSFKSYLMKKLYEYQIIKFNPEYLKKSLVNDMGFNSAKIRRILDGRFKEYHAKSTSVQEFIDIVMNKKQHFDLYPMIPKEVNCVFAMLKNLGLEANINKNIIIGLDYIRRR